MQTQSAQVSTRSEQDLLPGVRLPLEEEQGKKNILAVWQLPGSVLSQCIFAPLGMKALEDEWQIVIKAYKFTILEILRCVLSYIACRCYPYI